MKGIRRSLGWTILLVFAVLSLPGFAAKGGGNNGTDKAYSLVMDEQAAYDTSGPAPKVIAPVKVQAFLKNEAPPSTSASNIGSFELVITNPGVTIFYDEGIHKPSGATQGPPDVANGTVRVMTDPTTNANTRIVVTNMSPLKGKQVYVLTFWVTSCGDALWDANVRTGASLSGDTFTRINDTIDSSTHLATNLQTLISCGTLDCGESIDLVNDEASQTPELVVARGPYNSDGMCGAGSTFYASNKLLTARGQVHFRWPVGSADQPLAVWTYEVVSANSTVPKLAWLNNDGSKVSAAFPDPTVQPAQQPAYLDGSILQCKTTNGQLGILPAPYGALSANANINTSTIKVNTSPQNAVLPTPSATPFDIVIGTERMQVTAIQGTTWTVTRPTGGTPASSHSSGSKVMSTPLPLLPDAPIPPTAPFKATLADGTVLDAPTYAAAPLPYAFGKQAQMCIVGSPSLNSDGTYSTKIIDQSDGWVRIGNF
jgi:hypothetical protein